MRPVLIPFAVLLAAPAGGAPPGPRAEPRVTVTTYRYDLARSGANLRETVLTPEAVASGSFGKVWARRVDGEVYAQPLYLPGTEVPGRGTRTVLLVATEHDTVYALDADRRGRGLWKRRLARGRGVTPVPSEDTECGNLAPEIGITGTPVVDPATGTAYLVARTKEDGAWVQRLHALEVATGRDRPGSPVEIEATVPGTGEGGTDGLVPFDPLRNHQRCGLLLLEGTVFVAWASQCDVGPYHGWVLGFDAETLERTATFCATPDGGEGGIWMSGGAPAADGAGSIYLTTGNGTFSAASAGRDLGDAAVRLDPAAGLDPRDFFAPFDQAILEAEDIDLGSGGVLLLPDQPGPRPHLLLFGSKAGSIYLLDRDDLGGYDGVSDAGAVQVLPEAAGPVFGTPAHWNGRVYFQGADDRLRCYALQGGALSTAPVSMSSVFMGFPGASPVVSADGTGGGVVWALQTDDFAAGGPAILHAFDALDLADEIWRSDAAGRRDEAGPAVKFAVPVVAEGRVFVGAGGRVTAYGLR